MRVLIHIDTKMFILVTQLLLLTLRCASSCATDRYSFDSYRHSTRVAMSPHFQSHWVAHDAPLRNVAEHDVIRNCRVFLVWLFIKLSVKGSSSIPILTAGRLSDRTSTFGLGGMSRMRQRTA